MKRGRERTEEVNCITDSKFFLLITYMKHEFRKLGSWEAEVNNMGRDTVVVNIRGMCWESGSRMLGKES